MRALIVGLVVPFLTRRLASSPRLILAMGAFSIFGVLTILYSWQVSERFGERVGLEWRAYERSLGQDDRSREGRPPR